MRLDQLMITRGLAVSREKAKAMVMAGLVSVDGILIDKPGRHVPFNSDITVKEQPRYVSRGGVKLEAALRYFSVNVEGQVLLDVGASTGGFTDCLLQHGASRIISVDVGYGQFEWKLRQDPRISLLEKTNIRYLKKAQLEGPINGAVIDVSFISLKLVIPAVSKLLSDPSFIIALIKPQFEVGKGLVGKGGVVRDPKQHEKVLESLEASFRENGFFVRGNMPSPVLGPKGNREFLVYLTRDKSPDI